MTRIAIIGYGNLLREDDGIGRIAAERLAETLRDSRVKVYSCHQLGPELAETVAQVDCVVFIECATEGTPGNIVVRSITPDTPPSPSPLHRLDPATLVAAVRTFYDATPDAVVITVTGRDFDSGERLSRPVAAALPLVIRRVISLLALQGETPVGDKTQALAEAPRPDTPPLAPETDPAAPQTDLPRAGNSGRSDSFSGGAMI